MKGAAYKRVLVVTASLLMTIVVVTVYLLVDTPTARETVYLGSFFVSDSGESHGGWEYIATYAAELRVSGTSGTLTLTLQEAPGDVLDKHSYQVTSFQDLGTELRMDIDGHHTRLPLVADDRVWDGKFSGYHIAAYGPSSPPNEIIGEIVPETFPGLGPSFYVELRLARPGL